jgi:tetratricopeptide (TPR) repeat protein
MQRVHLALLASTVFLLTLTSCADQQARSLEQIRIQEEALDAIPRDRELLSDTANRLTTALLEMYADYIGKWPQDTASINFAYQSGMRYESLLQYNEALEWYDKVWKEHPRHRHASTACFRTGFICEKVLRDYEQARERYEGFARAYPDHPLAANMALQVQYLGDDAGLLKAILEARAAADSLALP